MSRHLTAATPFASAVALFVVLVLGPGLRLAVAQDHDAQAREHFEIATTHFGEGNYESALRDFEESYRLSGRAELLYNIALCHERLGNLAQAADNLDRFLRTVEHVDGRAALERRLANLRERQRQREADEEARAAARAASTGVPTAAWFSFAAAGVGAVGWGVFGVLAFLEHGDLEDECAERQCLEDDVSTLDTYSLLADVGFGLTVAGVVAGVIVVLATPGRSAAERSAAERASLTVLPYAMSDVVGLSASGAL